MYKNKHVCGGICLFLRMTYHSSTLSRPVDVTAVANLGAASTSYWRLAGRISCDFAVVKVTMLPNNIAETLYFQATEWDDRTFIADRTSK